MPGQGPEYGKGNTSDSFDIMSCSHNTNASGHTSSELVQRDGFCRDVVEAIYPIVTDETWYLSYPNSAEIPEIF